MIALASFFYEGEKRAEANPKWLVEAERNWLGLFTGQVATGDRMTGTTNAQSI